MDASTSTDAPAATFDYVIVGAGTAGCLLANRLSADPANRVLLIEAGGRDDWVWIHIPVGYLYCIDNPRTDWRYRTQSEPGLNGRALIYPRGRTLGGCSSINGMIYMRGQKGDYRRWVEAGNPGWDWEDVLPYYLRHEDHHSLDAGGADPLHGHGGEWRVERPRVAWEILDAFRDAAEQAGIPKSDDFNRGDNFGCGYFEVNQRRGIRWNASKAFLRPVLSRPNLTVWTDTHVRRVRFDGRRAVGVEVLRGAEPRDGDAQFVAARREVVLAAGSVGSVQLLQLSGVGPAEWLGTLDIPVVHDSPGVGENLQDHLQLRLAFKVHGVHTLNRQANSLFGKAWMGMQYGLFRRGPLTMSPSQLGAFVRSDPSVEWPDLEYHVQPLSLERFGEPLHPFPAFTASVCQLRPESRGTIHIVSSDWRDKPAIRPNYLSHPVDRAVAANAIRVTRRIVGMPALAKYAPEEFKPGPAYQTEEELAKAAGDIGTTIFHPVGTAKMGADDDPMAVVDGRLRVRGVTGLRVIDASVMPTITSGNTNSPTLMIAERGAEMILEDAKVVPRETVAVAIG
ncbi:MAG TPA: GMC family oxidoreductase N-terminal domain-containing protein [Burkholderiaceae bacterium]|nr:GMC family oxidoreductase N-terminal domain-containing protein [Burkholderiaceae bacterium]